MNIRRVSCLLFLALFCGRLSGTVTSVDYFTSFTNPVQVIISDQPDFTPISSDPGSGVTFANPHFFNWSSTLENYNPFTQGFGGSVTVDLPTFSNLFGLFAGANSDGTSLFNLDFYAGNSLVGSGSFVLPSGQPSTPIAAAFFSDASFDSVVLTAPSNGFMRINEDSIRFEASASVPDAASTGPLFALAAAGLILAARRRREQ